jgi:hypothetical protein
VLRHRFFSLVWAFAGTAVLAAAAAQGPPASDQHALTLAAQSIAALTGGMNVSDVTMTGSVVWNGTETGTATFRALGTRESRMDLALSSGSRSEVRDAQTGARVGQWINPDGSSGPFAFQNCQTDAVWFFPTLGSLAVGPNVVISYIGQETRNGGAVQHLRSYVYQTNPPPGIPTQQLSTMDFFLDATTLLPVAVAYNAHRDDGSMTNLPIEIDFSNYQKQSGVLVPMRIQRYSQGNLLVDMTVTNAAFNTGLSLSAFTASQP